jgi:periplasmic protein TonB
LVDCIKRQQQVKPFKNCNEMKKLILMAMMATITAASANAQATTDETQSPANVVNLSADTGKPRPKAKGRALEKVEVMPQFPGGEAKLIEYLHNNMQYPVDAMKMGIQGRVWVSFIVERDGNISEVKVKDPVDPNLDAEAMRVVKIMPRWTPGMEKGKTVRVHYMLPITFRMQ